MSEIKKSKDSEVLFTIVVIGMVVCSFFLISNLITNYHNYGNQGMDVCIILVSTITFCWSGVVLLYKENKLLKTSK